MVKGYFMEKATDGQIKVNALVNELVQRRITGLFKSFLEILEDVKIEHSTMLSKVSSKDGEEFVKSINYLTEEKCEHLRKKVLDSGNECSRDISSLVAAFDFYYNEERLKELSHKKSVKKVVGSVIY